MSNLNLGLAPLIRYIEDNLLNWPQPPAAAPKPFTLTLGQLYARRPSRAVKESAYKGHVGDGSSVQKHSAGPLYPCVLFAQETPQGVKWGVIAPQCQEGKLIGTEHDALVVAKRWLWKNNY